MMELTSRMSQNLVIVKGIQSLNILHSQRRLILRKAEFKYQREPWKITSVHTNGTIRIQCGNKSERKNIQRVKPFEE
jgi:hypothetical protein